MQQMTDNFSITGMQKDLKASAHPSTYLYDAHNIRLSQREGSTLLAVVNERGTSDTGITVPGTYLGHCLLNQYLVVFSKGEKDYIQRIDLENLTSFTLFEGNLNFSLEHLIQAVGSFECSTIQKVYWTDNYNQPRLINIAPKLNETEVVQGLDSIYTMYDFVPTLQLREEVRIKKLQDSTGVFPSGVIQYAFTYYKQYLQESNVFHTSSLLYTSPKGRGGAADERCSNAFSITITNVDINYDYLRIYSILRTSLNGTPVVKRVADLKVKDADHGTLTFVDTNNTGDLVDPSELLLKSTDTMRVGCMEQKDNTLFVGDVTIIRDLLTDLNMERATAVGTSTREIKVSNVLNNTYKYGNQLNAVELADDEEYYATQCSGFKKGDYYRVGIQFQHNTGVWSDPIFIRDCQIKTVPNVHSTSSIAGTLTIELPTIDVLVPSQIITKAINSGYLKVRPVVVFPDYQDRVTICQGIANDTITSGNMYSILKNVWSSWFFRPNYKLKSSDITHPQGDNGNITPSYYHPYFQHIPHLLRDSGEYVAEAGYDATLAREQNMLSHYLEYFKTVEYDGSYEENVRLKQTVDVATLHTPELEFDEQLLNWNYDEFIIRRVGDVFCKNTMYDLTIQTLTGVIGESSKGYGTRKTGIGNKSFGLVADYLYEDKPVDDQQNHEFLPMADLVPAIGASSNQKWLVMPWQRDGSFNNDVNRDGASDTLKIKIMSNLRYMDTKYYSDSAISNVSKENISVFDGISKDIVKVGSLNYYGNVDYALSSSREDGRYFKIVNSDSTGKTWRQTAPWSGVAWSNQDILSWNQDAWSTYRYWSVELGVNTWEAAMASPVTKITYKSTPHIVFNAPKNYSYATLFTSSSIAEEGDCTLPILSIERNVTEDFLNGLFGGHSKKALENNVWIPCGESVYMKPVEAPVEPSSPEYIYSYIAFPTLIGDLDTRIDNSIMSTLPAAGKTIYQDYRPQIVEELPENKTYIYVVASYQDEGVPTRFFVTTDEDWESLVQALYDGEIAMLTLSIEAHKGKYYVVGGEDVEEDLVELTPREWQRYAKGANYTSSHINIDTSAEHTEGNDRYWNIDVLGLTGKLYINKKTSSISLSVGYAQYSGFMYLNRELYADTFIMQEIKQDCISVRMFVEYDDGGTTVREEIVPTTDHKSNYDYGTHHYKKAQIVAEDINGNRLWLSAEEWKSYCSYLTNKLGDNYEYLHIDTTRQQGSGYYFYWGYLYYKVNTDTINTLTIGKVKDLPYPYIEFYDEDIMRPNAQALSHVLWDVVKIRRSDYIIPLALVGTTLENQYLTYRCFVREDYADMPYKALQGSGAAGYYGSYNVTLEAQTDVELEHSAHNISKNGHWLGITPWVDLQGTLFTLLVVPSQTIRFGIRIKKEKLRNSTGWEYKFRYLLGCIDGQSKWYSPVHSTFPSLEPVKDCKYLWLISSSLVQSSYTEGSTSTVLKDEMIEDGDYYYFEISKNILSDEEELPAAEIDQRNGVYGCAIFDFQPNQGQIPDSIEILDGITMSFVGKKEGTITDDDGSELPVYSGDIVLTGKYGDTYFQRYDHLKTYAYTEDDKNQVVEIGSFMVETRMNIDGRYDRNRGQQSNLYMAPKNFNLFNPVYSQTNNFFTYRIKPESYYENLETPNEIAWSLEKSSNAETDVWSDITFASSMEVDGSKGKVIDIKSFRDNIYCFQDRCISQIMFNSRVQIPTSDGVPIEISNSQKVDGYRIVQDGVGISNKKHLQRTPNGLYFIDSVTNELYIFNGAEFQNISQTRNMLSWFKESSIEQLLYDGYKHDLYTDNSLNVDECLAFSEDLGQFTSFMSYGGTSLIETFNKRTFAVQGNKLWEMYAGDYNNFFRGYKDWNITLISNGIDNKVPGIDKIYSTISYTQDLYNNGVYDTDKHFNYAQVWNEYQNTGEFALDQKLNNTTGENRHYAYDNTQKKFRTWRVQIPRAMKLANGVWRASMDRIRNPWCYVKLGRKASETQDTLKAVLQDIGVQYFV